MTSTCTYDVSDCSPVPRIASSHQTPWILRMVRTLAHSVTTFYLQLKRRRKFIALLNYDDHMIDDMGLTRPLIEEASRLPLKANAAIIARVWAKQK